MEKVNKQVWRKRQIPFIETPLTQEQLPKPPKKKKTQNKDRYSLSQFL
jgi:hypothetical protein